MHLQFPFFFFLILYVPWQPKIHTHFECVIYLNLLDTGVHVHLKLPYAEHQVGKRFWAPNFLRAQHLASAWLTKV